jgi:predicted AlkP superfamily phosphohydrolase/phosphomutase
LSLPATGDDEFTVTGMLTPSKEADGFRHPADFLDEFDGLDQYQIDSGEGKDSERSEFLADIEGMVSTRFDLTLYAIEQAEVDVLFVVFTAPDRLSHFSYHLYDEDHPFRTNESEAALEEHADVLPGLFRELDTKLGTIIETLEAEYGTEPVVSVISDHGMKSLERIFHVNKWLAQEGYLVFDDQARESTDAVDEDAEDLLDSRVDYIFGKVDWAETQAYAMGKRGAIYVNLEGREPQGAVPPEERNAVVASIREQIDGVTDPETGAEIVEAIHGRQELFEGPHVERAPDLLLTLSEGYYPFGYAFELDEPNLVSTNDWPDMPFVTGIEAGPGIIGISGEGIATDASDLDIGLEDVVPTLLHHRGHPVPADMDGRVVEELIEDDWVGEVEYDHEGSGSRSTGETDEDQQQLVKDRLEDLGYIYKIHRSDVLVFLDDVEYTSGSWMNRNRIKTPDGWSWLTVPVRDSAGPIHDVDIATDQGWRDEHWKSFTHNYGGAEHFAEWSEFFEAVYDREWESLYSLNRHLLETIAERLGLDYEFVEASTFGVEATETERLVRLCEAVDGDTYFSGGGADEYTEESVFEEAGIDLVYQSIDHPTYPQRFDEFVPKLSIVDPLCNVGSERTAELIDAL